jgi:uncharacterized YigZ family protein
LDPDRYGSIGDGPEVELRVQGSRFLGRALAAHTGAGAARGVDAIRKKHHPATHHAWALRLGEPGRVVERTDDDGEPAGTAGRPILARLAARELHDALVVVTRYFGGVKLGTGGLVRAYGEAAELALAAAPVREVPIVQRIEITCSYDDLGAVETAIARVGDRVQAIERGYEAGPSLQVTVLRSGAAPLTAAIVHATAGRAAVRSA